MCAVSQLEVEGSICSRWCHMCCLIPRIHLILAIWGCFLHVTACVFGFDTGNGEQGKAFPLTDSDRVDQAYRENGFNIYISDRISLNRSLPDIRHAKWVPYSCSHKPKTYIKLWHICCSLALNWISFISFAYLFCQNDLSIEFGEKPRNCLFIFHHLRISDIFLAHSFTLFYSPVMDSFLSWPSLSCGKKAPAAPLPLPHSSAQF